MTTRYKDYEMVFGDSRTMESITASGGQAVVMSNGAPDLVTLYNPASDYASLAQGVALSRGRLRFATLDTVEAVDVGVMLPGGQFEFIAGVKPKSKTQYLVDLGRKHQLLKVGFSYASGAATEVDTLIDFPTNAMIQGAGALVTALDATETIDIGLLSSESGGDADGFAALLSVAALGAVEAAVAVTVGGTETYYSGNTVGALIRAGYIVGTNVDQDYGLFARKAHRIDGTAKSLTWTLSTGSDTAKGYLLVPYLLAA